MLDRIPPLAELARSLPVGQAGLVDLDLSMFVMLGLFLLLFLVLRKRFHQPMLEMFDKRHELTGGAREAADVAVRRAEARIAEYGARVGETHREASQEQKRLRAEALASQRELIEAVRRETEEEMARGRAELDAAVAAARPELLELAERLGEQIAERVVGGGA